MPILPELVELLEGMSEQEQAIALQILRERTPLQGVSGKLLIGELGESFVAQTRHIHLPTEDMDEMLRVIEENCEIVDDTPPIVTRDAHFQHVQNLSVQAW
jgi:hypothetical protein